MSFASDSFTDTAGTTLPSHTMTSGGPWVTHTSYSNVAVISDANRARSNSTSLTFGYYATTAPGGADYDVSADVFCASKLGSMGVAGRMSAVADTMYFARYNAGTTALELYSLSAGTAVQLGTIGKVFNVGETHNIRLSMVGTAIKVYWDGAGSPDISVTNSTVTAAGGAGIRGVSAATGGSNATSYHLDNFLATVAASAPSNSVAPAVTGTAQVGSVLTTTNGTWTDNGSPTFTYQWQRDVAGNSSYSNISSATSSTYTLVSADDTCHVRCVVTDTDANGATAANSNAAGVVTFPVPVNSVAPVVTGSTPVGSLLTTTNGTWSNSPTSFTYQWTRAGSNIAAATSSTYTTVNADGTKDVACKVTAVNDGGSSSPATSNAITVNAVTLSTVVGKTGTTGTAVMQKAGSGYTYVTGKTGTSGTAVDQKGAGSFTKVTGH